MNRKCETNKRKMENRSALFNLAFLILSFPVILSAVETTLSMELWPRYTLEMKEDADELSESQFALKRGYFRIEPKFNDKIKGRFNLDFFSSEKSHDGAGIKLKYAYLDFKELFPIPESRVSFGLIKPYFGVVYDWNYTTIQKSLEDKEKVIASTDYGVAMYGYIPGGFGEYALGMYNGEGYKKTGSKVNINPAGIVNLRTIPIPGLTLGGSVLYEKAGIPDTLVTKYTERLLYSAIGHIAFGPIDILGEFLVKNYDDTMSQGFMVMPILKLWQLTEIDVDIVGRIDQWDKDKNIDDDMHRRVIGGLNWYILRDEKGKPLVWIQINGERKFYEDKDKPYIDELGIQLRWKFVNKIKG